MAFTTMLALVFSCIVMEGFFSGTEIALISLNRHRLAHRVESGNIAAILLERQFRFPANLYATTSIGTNVSVVTGTAVMTAYLSELKFRDADFLAVLAISPLTLLFGEIFPKAFFQKWAEKASYAAIYPLIAAQKIFAPVRIVSAGIARLIMSAFGIDASHDPRSITHEEIKSIFAAERKDMDLHPEEQKIINRIFGLKHITVEQCMVPLIHLTALEKKEPMSAVRAKLEESKFSRLPVFSERIFNIVGVINAFDVLRYGDTAKTAADLARPAFYVYKKKKVDDLMQEMQRAGVQMAVVVNEYSDAIGITSMEDLMEEIFGEIQDEYDKEQEQPQAREIGQGRWLADGAVEVDFLNEKYGLGLPNGDYETLAGYVLTLLDRIPRKGEAVTHGDFKFVVRDATERGIKSLEMTKIIREKKEVG
ncbi:MAG: HlyC/CorC family transporter [Nitrospinae bacterium]|nr:HlyC/CorC family transporter [Nitrospinota bacterium]